MKRSTRNENRSPRGIPPLVVAFAVLAAVAPRAASSAPGGGGGAGGADTGGEGGRPAERAMSPPDEEDARCGCEFDPFGALAVAGLVPLLRRRRPGRR